MRRGMLFQLSDFYEGKKQVEFIRQSLSVTHNISEITSNGKYFKQLSWYSMGLIYICMALIFLVSMFHGFVKQDTS